MLKMGKLKYALAAAGVTVLLLTTQIVNCEQPSYQSMEVVAELDAVRNVETMQQLEDIIANNENVVVDFYSTWCSHCKTYDPVFKSVAEEYKGKAVFCKVILDKIPSEDHKKIVDKYKVKNIPKTVLFKDGEEIYSKTGAIKKSDLSDMVNIFLVGKNKA